MACLDMYNSEHKMSHHHHHHHRHHGHFMQVSPRISFSNDFVDAQQAMRQELMRASSRPNGPEAAASSDFEFSAAASRASGSMMSADELFFKGRLLPFKGTALRGSSNNGDSTMSSSSQRVTTLRDELLQGDNDVTLRPVKGRWKSLLGLKRAHGGSHSKGKAEKATLHEEAHVSKNSQELMNEEFQFGT